MSMAVESISQFSDGMHEPEVGHFQWLCSRPLSGRLAPVCALAVAHNIIGLAMPPASDVFTHNGSADAPFNLVEQVFGIATVALLMIVITKVGTDGRNSIWLLDCAATIPPRTKDLPGDVVG